MVLPPSNQISVAHRTEETTPKPQKVAVEWQTLLLRSKEVQVSNLDTEIGFSDSSSTRFSLVHPSKCWNCTSN
jgi:hypothetical protein